MNIPWQPKYSIKEQNACTYLDTILVDPTHYYDLSTKTVYEVLTQGLYIGEGFEEGLVAGLWGGPGPFGGGGEREGVGKKVYEERKKISEVEIEISWGLGEGRPREDETLASILQNETLRWGNGGVHK